MLNNYDNHGIAYQTWATVSRLLATMTANECMEAWGELEHEFMTPQIELFQVSPDAEYLDKLGEDAGYYARLSASGYMDCTEWSGPFETEEEAMAELISVYCD